ncbi:MAG TPA: hypothetical protein VM261_18535, partial [Kofleriaceae bacterium]|nr:hypothetical protein [Kofleriaceae bacterium]
QPQPHAPTATQPQPQPQPQPLSPIAIDASVPGDVALSEKPVVAPDVAIYAQAERALKLGDTALADELLARLVVNFDDSELVDDALFERARCSAASPSAPAIAMRSGASTR